MVKEVYTKIRNAARRDKCKARFSGCGPRTRRMRGCFVAYLHLTVEISGYYRYIRIVMSGIPCADAVSGI